MKKLLLSLSILSSLAIADNLSTSNDYIANIIGATSLDEAISNDLLPNGFYTGEFTTYTGRRIHGEGNSTNNHMELNLQALPELCGYTAKLRMDVSLAGATCGSTNAILHLDQGSCMFAQDHPITFRSCTWNGSNLNGTYEVTRFPILKGSFGFTHQ